jgi:hypothetical protein
VGVAESAGLQTIVLADEFEQGRHVDPQWLLHLQARGEVLSAETPNPLTAWADISAEAALPAVEHFNPNLLISSLFCCALADELAKKRQIPWCFINPSFYFGPGAARTWEDDFVGLGAGWFRHILLPHCQEADLTLHATDPQFDPHPAGLPAHHHYVGPLNLEPPSSDEARFLDEPGPPWALISLSTVPMGGELVIAQAALTGLSSHPVRTLLTLAPEYPRSELGALPENAVIAGFVPHSRVLERAALVVSHAGHGIVMKSLYFGVPMLLIPWARDQFGVAARAEALGVAIVVEREDCSESNVLAALDRLVTDERLRQRAAKASERLRQQSPEAEACLCIEAFINAR